MKRTSLTKTRLTKTCFCLLAALTICFPLNGCYHTMREPEPAVTLIIKVPELPMNAVTSPEITEASMFLQQAGDAFAKQYDKADVSIRLETFGYSDEIRAVTDCFDTEDATDILYEGYFNMASYLHTGRVVPLDDIISETLRNDIDESYWAMSMAEGRTYMMPFLSVQNIMVYNKKLFQSCGLSQYISSGTSIQNWTLREWNQILDTLAAKLPDRIYPVMMYGKNSQGDTHIMALIHAFGGTLFDDNGNFDFSDEKTVRALAWIQKGVDRGWYPPNPQNLELSDCHELFTNDQLAIHTFNNGSFTLSGDTDNYGFVNFPGNTATSFVTGFEVFDNGDPAKIAAAKDFIRFIYENEAWLAYSAGNIPASRSISEKYGSRIMMLEEFTANAIHVKDFPDNAPNWQGSHTSVRSVFWPQIHRLLAGRHTPEECASALNQVCNAALTKGRQNSRLHSGNMTT